MTNDNLNNYLVVFFVHYKIYRNINMLICFSDYLANNNYIDRVQRKLYKTIKEKFKSQLSLIDSLNKVPIFY